MKQKLIFTTVAIIFLGSLIIFGNTNALLGSSNDKSDYTQTLESLKSYNNQNRLTADMRNTLLDTLKNQSNEKNIVKEETTIKTDEIGFKVYFYTQRTRRDHPDCNNGFEKIDNGTQHNGGHRSYKSVVCKQKIPTKIVQIGSKCIKNISPTGIGGLGGSIQYEKGEINKYGKCISINEIGNRRFEVQPDGYIETTIPQSETEY